MILPGNFIEPFPKKRGRTHKHKVSALLAYHAVCVLREPLQGEQGVVGLDHHITHLILVGEHRVRLHQFLGVPEDGVTGERFN